MHRTAAENLFLIADRLKKILKAETSVVINMGRPTSSNIILFESFNGTRADDSPRAIYEYMREAYSGQYVYVWALDAPELYQSLASNDDTIVCKYGSSLHHMYCCTARVLINNCVRDGSLPSRKGQLWLNTWHGGGAYKTVGSGQHGSNALRNAYYYARIGRTDYFLSCCGLFTDIELRRQMGYTGKVLPYGLPKNDQLIKAGLGDVERVRELLRMPQDACVVLVAPTQRGDSSCPLPDVSALRTAIKERFGVAAWVVYRGHHDAASRSSLELSEYDADLSGHPNVNEVLLASDVLITDFSSILWSFALTRKPLFLFAPDVDEYSTDRGFCVPPQEWGFPIATNDDELVANIESFHQDEYDLLVERHFRLFGSYERGEATCKVAGLLHEVCQGGKDDA